MSENIEAIKIVLLAFSENYRTEVTKDLTSLWVDSFKNLGMDEIRRGGRRCLNECEFMPNIAVFREKIKSIGDERSGLDVGFAGAWTDAPKIENKSKKVGMPTNVKKLLQELLAEASKNQHKTGLTARTVHGTENGLDFKITRDAHGRDYVYYKNRPEPKPKFMNGY